MGRETTNRREFLLGAGGTIGSVALGPHRKASLHGKMRGLMVDAGRVPERLEYYRRVIDFCVDWELNTLQFRLADDQGTALRFSTVPDLVTHKNAFSPGQLKTLAEYAQNRGIDLIPELESFGHTGYITRSPAYAHLLDRDAKGSAEFTGVIPVSPETLGLFENLYREIAAIFPSIYLHGGCDEVNWGGSELSRKALQTKTRADIWVEYLNSLQQIAATLNRQLIVWGDVVVHQEPEILPQLSKNILIMDWDYREQDSTTIRETIRKVGAHGLRAIGAPGLINYRWGPRVGTAQLRNIGAFADAYLDDGNSNSLGAILTNWVPSRYVQNSIWDGFCYAAVAFNEGTLAAESSGFRRFVENHYGAKWNELWRDVFREIYDSAPSVQEQSKASGPSLRLRAPWSTDQQLAETLRIRPSIQHAFTPLRRALVQLEPTVLKNKSDFRAFSLCVDALERLFWRESVVIERASSQSLDRQLTDQLILEIAEHDRTLTTILSKDWDTGRFPDAVAKSELLFDLEPKDQLLFEWALAADYSASLASHPERFHQLLAASKNY